MNAVVFHEHGGPGKLQYQDMPMPTIGVDEVLVRVKACALNHLAIWIAMCPTPLPAPMINTSSPGRMSANPNNICQAVTDTNGNAAACSKLSAPGTGKTFRAGTFTYSAYPP